MRRLDRDRLERHRRHNRVVTVAVMAGLVVWLALVGWMVVGPEGMVWAALAAILILVVQPVRSVTLLKALYGARTLTPADAPGLYRLMRELATRAEMPRVPPLLYLPRRDIIALSTGWGDDAAIAVSDGLLRLLAPRELAAVLAHETAHLRHGDLKILRLADTAGRLTRFLSLIGLFLVIFYLPAALFAEADVPAWPVLLLVLAPVASDLLTFKLSRIREFDADTGAAALTGDPEGLILALERIDAMQTGGWERLRPGWGWLAWLRTHPSTAERVARLDELAPIEPGPSWITLPEAMLMPGFRAPQPPRWRWPL